jgi:hypothetical protein
VSERPQVRYRGHSYWLIWSGNTKYGHRAHLSFLDESKTFWCDADAVEGLPSAPTEAQIDEALEAWKKRLRLKHASTRHWADS